MYYPPFIIRVLDKQILKLNENYKYTYINDPVSYEWNIEQLNEPNFIKIWSQEYLQNYFN